MGKRLTVLPWSCAMTGDCCRNLKGVTMTVEEAQRIKDAVPESVFNKLIWAPVAKQTNGHFISLQANPCPLLDTAGRCTVYVVRPYNCRRFICLRPDPSIEPYEPEPIDTERKRYGCANLSDRVNTDRAARRFFQVIQRKAQRWAIQNGWSA